MNMQDETEINSSTGRRWLYGFNVAVLILLALSVMGFFFYFTAVHNKPFDWTSNGLYSLSGATKNVLHEIEEKKQNYTLINLYAHGEGARAVGDLLDEYSRGTGNVKVQDGAGMTQEEIEKPVRALYAAENKPYEETLGEFDKLALEVENFYKSEGKNFGALAQKPGLTMVEKRDALQNQTGLSVTVVKQIEEERRIVREKMGSVSVNWPEVQTAVKAVVDEFGAQLEANDDPAKVKERGFSPAIVSYFGEAKGRYSAMLEKVMMYETKLEGLQPLKGQEVLNALTPDSILVVGPTSAKVITDDAVFLRSASGDAPPSFVGEQAVSSALLSMERPEKVKVVFVAVVPQMWSTSVMSDAAQMLRDNNYEVMDWAPAVATQNDPMPQGTSPPAEGKGVVWVVFPPPMLTEQQREMQVPEPNPGPVIDAVKKHLAEGGNAVFLAEGVEGMPLGGTDYVYGELVKSFGVDVETKYKVVHEMERQSEETGQTVKSAVPELFVKRYSEHAITKTLDSYMSYFGPCPQAIPGYTLIPTVVRASEKPVAGAVATVILTTPEGADYWASSDMEPSGTFDAKNDLASPVPLGVAAVRNGGDKEKEQRIVVIGHALFASNWYQEVGQNALRRDGQEVHIPAFPANADLFNNSVMWASGYGNMIAVSAKANTATRINISDSAMTWIKWGILFTGAPAAALVLGGVVWFVRKR